MNEHNAPELIFEHAKQLRLVPSDEDIAALAQRNEDRRKAATRALGQRWVGVPLPRTETQQ